MGYVVRMPQLGMTMEEGIVVEWAVDDGEPFSEGDLVAVVESEKTTNDIEAREDGQIRERFVDLEEPVGPGDPIAYVGEEGESVPDDIEVPERDDADAGAAEDGESAGDAAATDAASGASATGSVDGDAKVSPRARSYARENDIDESLLPGLSGSGPDGAVIEQDVIAAADSLTGAAASASAAGTPAANAPAAGASAGRVGGEPQAGQKVSVSGRGIYEERGKSGLRRSIADQMSRSIEAPQVTLNRRAPVDDLLAVKERLEADRDLKLSITDFLLAAVVEAIEEYPELNGIYEDGVHKLAGNVNIGVAVDIEGGLITPVIEGAAQRTTAGIREERQRLVSLAQSGEYTMDDLSGGTFTVTNLGHFGVESFDPRLNPPEVAILGVNAIQTRYDPETDETVKELGLSLTFDHRAVDGADAARFLDALIDALEHPLRLVSLGATPQSGGPFVETDAGPDGDRIARTHSEGGMQATVRSGRFEWAVDEPEDQGGEDTAPNPVEQFVGSLASCLTLMVGHMADRREIDVDDVRVTAQAFPPEGRIERIEVDVDVVSADDADDVRTVVQMAERACYVNQVIDDDIERDVDVTITAP